MSDISEVAKVTVKIAAFETFFLDLECATPEDFDIVIEILREYKTRQNVLALSRRELLRKKVAEINE